MYKAQSPQAQGYYPRKLRRIKALFTASKMLGLWVSSVITAKRSRSFPDCNVGDTPKNPRVGWSAWFLAARFNLLLLPFEIPSNVFLNTVAHFFRYRGFRQNIQ